MLSTVLNWSFLMEEIPLWYWLLVFFGFGACVGSFYNVIVYRMPRGMSLISPPSHCPLCKKPIPLYYNLPIVGWLLLRGKSACCKQPISIIYPIGEGLCGFLGALALYAASGFTTDFTSPVLDPSVWAEALALFWLLLAIYPVFAVDCKYMLIPDSISIGGIVAGLLISIIPGGVTPFESLLGAVTAGGGLFLLGWLASRVLKKEAMGFGDVKLLAGYGALMGITGAVETLLVAAILGIIVMVPYAKIKSKANGQIPFGPFLAISAPAMCLWGNQLINLYVSLVLAG